MEGFQEMLPYNHNLKNSACYKKPTKERVGFMEDLESMKHAKYYIEQLAKGIDPLTGDVMEDDATLNQVRITRCFCFNSQVLAKVIENGGVIVGISVAMLST